MKLNFPIVFSLTCAIAASANAAHKHKSHHHAKHEEPVMQKHEPKMNEDYNFATLKGGIVMPTPLDGNAGLNVGNDTFTAGLSVGRKFEDRYALELEYMYRGKSNAKAYAVSPTPGTALNTGNAYWKTSSNTFMINAMADLVKCDMVTPYVKVGAGVSANKADDYVYTETQSVNNAVTYTYSGKTNNAFAWQAGAGLNMKTTDMFDTQLQYMYIDRGTVKTQANFVSGGTTVPASARTGRMKDHVVTIGLTKKF